ncbi:MAG: hypothetical protein RMY16_14425 [Nostoc sp. DedQUE12b]|uniref:hypothetical protein n=1 Tax=Nostoc sp. DedQUE12b TaxID=3075398 RepID=UPI002AD53F81|nr:hypothetical protein [Nostoc sp. DedQUE12b]MDZ8086733.1 hypothetical protein [Nostoc sp. DedQUE12b]
MYDFNADNKNEETTGETDLIYSSEFEDFLFKYLNSNNKNVMIEKYQNSPNSEKFIDEIVGLNGNKCNVKKEDFIIGIYQYRYLLNREQPFCKYEKIQKYYKKLLTEKVYDLPGWQSLRYSVNKYTNIVKLLENFMNESLIDKIFKKFLEDV